MGKQNSRALSLSALTVLELSPPQMVECAAEAGYDFVGLRLLPATDHEVRHEIVGDTPMRRETLARLRDTGVRVLDAEILRVKPDTDVAAYAPMLETAAELGARYVLVAGNDPDEARTAERLAQLCDLAAPLGLTPSLEPMPWTDAKDITQAARIVKAAGRRNTGLIVDPIHFDRARSSTEELRALPREYFGYSRRTSRRSGHAAVSGALRADDSGRGRPRSWRDSARAARRSADQHRGADAGMGEDRGRGRARPQAS
jgi:sugar phosphate isomerase/epimerase